LPPFHHSRTVCRCGRQSAPQPHANPHTSIMRYKIKKQYRLPYFNYARSGYYFVTICSYRRREIFSSVYKGEVILTDIGRIIQRSWEYIPVSSPFASLDESIIMPNHLHGIIRLDNPDEADTADVKFEMRKRTLSVVMRTFKAAVTARARAIYPGIKLWQPLFFDRIVRNEEELLRIRKYIVDNPLQWEKDRNNLENVMM
jgi:putative transposase